LAADLNASRRDLKPENILLQPSGQIKVTDFGMSKEFGVMSCHTRDGIGTIAYNPPELFGESGMTGSYDPRPVDVWGIGVTLYVMVAGVYPFGAGMVRNGDYHETVRKICSPDFVHEPLPPEISADLRDLLARVLCVDASRRLTVEQISRHPWCAQGPAYFPPPPPLAYSPRPPKEWSTLWPPAPAQPNFFDSGGGDEMFGAAVGSWGSASMLSDAPSPLVRDEDEL
jgi:5'-AMP-activated protein kinase catalytic alpha subunit